MSRMVWKCIRCGFEITSYRAIREGAIRRHLEENHPHDRPAVSPRAQAVLAAAAMIVGG